MNKALKLDKGEQKATDILAKRIMPKTDFKKVLDHDQLYWNTLNQYFEFCVIKADIMGKKATEIIKQQNRETIIENIDLLCDWTETQVKCLDLKGKLHIQKKLIDDKTTHFENVFMPQYNKEVEEMKSDFNKTLKLSKERLKTAEEKKGDKRLDGIVHKLKFELDWWGKVEDKDRNNPEFKLQIWKPLKRLNSAFDKKVNEIKEEAKYLVK